LFYSWARVSALVALKVDDYYQRKGALTEVAEKARKIHEVLVHSKARETIEQWLLDSGLSSNLSAPLI
jgi:site-specific recombinase XerC